MKGKEVWQALMEGKTIIRVDGAIAYRMNDDGAISSKHIPTALPWRLNSDVARLATSVCASIEYTECTTYDLSFIEAIAEVSKGHVVKCEAEIVINGVISHTILRDRYGKLHNGDGNCETLTKTEIDSKWRVI
jgi:hypothetical protein